MASGDGEAGVGAVGSLIGRMNDDKIELLSKMAKGKMFVV